MCFAMKDLGPLCYFSGLEAHFTNEGLYLTKTKYTMDLSINSEMDGAKPYASPVVAGSKLSIHDGHPLEDPTKYRSIVGALQYLSLTRQDIAFSVNQVCQFVHNPTITHWAVVKCILLYLKGTADHELFF